MILHKALGLPDKVDGTWEKKCGLGHFKRPWAMCRMSPGHLRAKEKGHPMAGHLREGLGMSPGPPRCLGHPPLKTPS